MNGQGGVSRLRPNSTAGTGLSRPTSRLHARSLLSLLTLLAQTDAYDGVDLDQLYRAALQVVVLEYYNLIRFTAPTVRQPMVRLLVPPALAPAGKEVKLSLLAISNLEDKLRLVAQMKDLSIDADTRRSLLELYNKMLQPQFKQELARTKLAEYVFMTFIGCVQMALSKSQKTATPEEKVRQADIFILMLRTVTKGKEEAVMAKMCEHRDLLKPSLQKPQHQRQKLDTGEYTQPLFRMLDFEGTSAQYLKMLQQLFEVDDVTAQQDIIAVKDRLLGKCLHADITQARFYLDKDLGFYPPEKFVSHEAYFQWKQRQQAQYTNLQKKYRLVPLHNLPKLPSGHEYYMWPLRHTILPFYIILIKLCYTTTATDKLLIDPVAQELLALIARVWGIDASLRCVCYYTAAHLAKITSNDADVVNTEVTRDVVGLCFQVLQEAEIAELPKRMWAQTDQDNWTKNLLILYNQTMYGIKELLAMIFNTTVKPQFGTYLSFLGDYVEGDELFDAVEALGKTAPWEKKLAKSLVKTVNNRYREHLMTLPRDDTVNIGHFIDISSALVDDIKRLQKRYKAPLLGFLPVAREVAQIYTKAFAKDLENILKHIDAYAKNKAEFIPYGDAIEAYKLIAEVRAIHRQVLPEEQFLFNIEAFFFKYLEDWVAELGEKIEQIVQNAIKLDKFDAIDLDSDDKRVSTLVVDMFAMIKQYFGILKQLVWEDEYQLAKVYTILLKLVSDGVIAYANTVADKVTQALHQSSVAEEPERERSHLSTWLADMKQAVALIQRGQDEDIQRPYQFEPQTCIALNNINRIMELLDKLDTVDPEAILAVIQKRNPLSATQYLLHLVLIRLVKAENLALLLLLLAPTPYVTMIDTKLRKTVAQLRPLTATTNPDWDEEFEVTLPASESLTLSVTVWDKRSLNHSICGRALLAIDPNRFGVVPQEIYLDLDTQGRVKLEVLVELERLDAVFVMGKAYRTLKRCLERCIKLMVEKFSRFIHYCLLRLNLRQVCSSGRPTQEQIDDAMMPLYNYLNSGLEVLALYLTRSLLLQVMVAAWNVVLATADSLLLPLLVLAKTLHLLHSRLSQLLSSWQAVSLTIANVTHSITGNKPLTTTELETVFSWLNFLCFDFFHNNGAGPPISDLKNDHYQALLYIPNYYDADIDQLIEDVEQLAPAYIQTLRDKNNIDTGLAPKRAGTMLRARTVLRSKTIAANATAKARAKAAKEAKEAQADPYAADAQLEDIILRILIARGEKRFVADRLHQREKLALSIATERIIKAAAEGKIGRRK